MISTKKKFPDGFYFGASTSSHQVEGNCVNDWSNWEKRNAGRLASESVKYSNLHSWSRISGKAVNPENYISGNAVDHYNRYTEDINIAKKIGLNAYRFSIEWSRIEPEPGVWNEHELDHYLHLVKSLRKKGIEPFVTIWHWTLPLWLAEQGGIMHPEFPWFFAWYAAKVSEKLKGEVKYFITINEPEIYSLNSYMRGIWPPQKTGIISYIRAMKQLIKAHKFACDMIKTRIPGALIGAACNMTYFESGGGINNFFAYLADRFWNRRFIEKTFDSNDFIAINYYFHNRIQYGFNKNVNDKVSDLGWELYPQGVENVIMKMTEYGLPIFITESGLADNEDRFRPWYIEETLRAIYKTIENGADVRGYFHWSLLDNFEWDKGFWPAFGLVEVDRTTMKRKPRSRSIETYKRIITRGIE